MEVVNKKKHFELYLLRIQLIWWNLWINKNFELYLYPLLLKVAETAFLFKISYQNYLGIIIFQMT